ncbi:MAG: hypothetical protein R3E12_19840 [Candidatus Eisenbacteria bacterium]|uniref:Uncharacterized protein n=1 Tax=Eiseniibacteriota bacterium TaxID=2212470 RepID=A0A956M203_UNCEI|nr:hypothetical protein [Candidatus Eisenbacteria bacterium]
MSRSEVVLSSPRTAFRVRATRHPSSRRGGLPRAAIPRLGGRLLVFAALIATVTVARAGPFQDGVLFLHVNGDVVYTPGEDPRGSSDGVVCEDAVTSVPIGDATTVCFVVAGFPPRTAPTLRTVSFGIDYDPALLEIVETRHDGFPLDRSPDWPLPGTSIHLQLGHPVTGRSHEILWFAVRQRTDQPAELRLEIGEFGGEFGTTDLISGFGTFGFGRPGALGCPPLSTCCLPDLTCELLTATRCDDLHGLIFEDAQDCTPCSDTGACCAGWTCSVELEEACTASGGDFHGSGTSCEPNDCIPYGACCQRDGECVISQQDDCPDYAFLIDATCDPSPCSELGACCYGYSADACVLTTEDACMREGSEFRGAGTDCEPQPCLGGLCCIEQPVCLYATREDCDQRGGTYSGGYYGPIDDFVCNLACFGYPPVREVSWGEVKKRFRGASND